MREVALLALLVVGEPAFELAMLSLVGFRGRLGTREVFGNCFPSPLELSETWTQRSQPSVERVDHIVVGLQREQRFEILMHSHPPFEIAPQSRGNGVTNSHRGLPR